MSYCLNPYCSKPRNTNDGRFCLTCGSKLLLKERYRALKPIGRGGFGRTFLAVDEDKPSKPRCVIKQFHPQAQGTSTLQKAVELFTQEAIRLDELGQHSQIPELLAYFTQEDRQYLIQEFIDGQNLAQEIAQKGAFDERQIHHLLNNLLFVLQFCHARQVIHRDIKPENIIRRRLSSSSLTTEGENTGDLVLVDFGAAKFVTSTALHRTGTSIGSPEYVAPEQIRGKAVFASDIYSLGVTCIHLLTQRSPFDLYDVHNDTWMWQQYLKTPVSQELSEILNKMLETAIARRYQTVDEVLKDLNCQSLPAAPSVAVTNTSNWGAKTHDPIEQELEEVKTIFHSNNHSVSTNAGIASQPTQPLPMSSKSIIDEELEELRAKYSGNNNS